MRNVENLLGFLSKVFTNFVTMLRKTEFKICFYWNSLAWFRPLQCQDLAMKMQVSNKNGTFYNALMNSYIFLNL